MGVMEGRIRPAECVSQVTRGVILGPLLLQPTLLSFVVIQACGRHKRFESMAEKDTKLPRPRPRAFKNVNIVCASIMTFIGNLGPK